MPLSKDTLKNLLDVMQKVSLAIAAVSIALLSNILLSHHNIERDAEPELDQLLKIRDKIATSSPRNIIDNALIQAGQEANRSEPFRVELRTLERPRRGQGDLPAFSAVQFSFPHILFQNSDYNSEQKPFGDFNTLEELRMAWDTVAATTKFCKLGKPFWIYIRISALDKTYAELSYHELPEGVDAVALRCLGHPVVRDLTKPSAYISIRYDFSPMLTHIEDQDKLMRFLGLAEDQRDKLQDVELSVEWYANAQDFSPSLAFGPEFRKKRNFAEAFPNLARLPDLYQKEGLNSLSTLLEEKAQQSNEQIEVLGAKISTELLSLLGLPALIILLFQFAAVGFHITSSINRLEVEEASQWSLLLSGWPFLILSFGTIFVLPVGASVLTFLIVPGKTFLPTPTIPALVILVLVCGVAAFLALQKLRLRVLRNPSVQRKRREAQPS